MYAKSDKATQEKCSVDQQAQGEGCSEHSLWNTYFGPINLNLKKTNYNNNTNDNPVPSIL